LTLFFTLTILRPEKPWDLAPWLVFKEAGLRIFRGCAFLGGLYQSSTCESETYPA
jgi:hypothetical protein